MKRLSAIRVRPRALSVFQIVDQVLRGRTSEEINQTNSNYSLRTVASLLVIAGPIYGAAMGCYAAVAELRPWSHQWLQMFYSSVKVPLLLLATLAIALPSFFVITTLVGLRNDFRESLRAILMAQSGLTIILLSFMPITLFMYVSLAPYQNGYSLAVIFNAIAFGGASIAAQLLLRKHYQVLVQKNARHRWMVQLWILLYAFVGIQMAYVLRPFIGSPYQATTFFRQDPFENAYVRVLQLIWSAFKSMLT